MHTRDGRTLYAERSGSTATTGSPTVVFEAGMGASRSTWGAVVPTVAAHTATVAYDRSGLGRSAPAADDRSLPRLVDDLLDVLAEIDGPVVLVGHSWGGPIVRRAAAVVPDRVVGVVLVDPTDERCGTYFSISFEKQNRRMAALTPALARIGLLRRMVARQSTMLPADAAAAMRAEDGTVVAGRTMAAEMLTSVADIRALRADPPAVPSVPVTVVTGGRSGRLDRRRRAELLAAHTAYVADLPNGRHVVAENSGHLIPFTEPGVIAEEILRLV
ncbi:alpha/beta fold hydrolase [Tsukamurella soli]|uniref:Alpha/beta hydrolase n=1 Tax=Tsukamurella soli TaxID=644556 RepID=A0ABP8J749_9ACTN